MTYNVSDAAGNAATEVTRTVNVLADTEAPVITLIGNATIELNVGEAYVEQGATAIDNIDGDLSANIVIGGDAVNTNAAGTYVVTYNVSDAAGNAAMEITRTVNVLSLPPVEYCSSSGNVAYVTGVSNVIFNTINNSDVVNDDVPYEDFTAISTTVQRSSSYDLSVSLNTDGNYTINAMTWIDWNRDGDFEDAGETYQMGTTTNSLNGPTSLSPRPITVPQNAALGTTRMRVSAKWNEYPTSCENGFDGEVEDYTIIVEEAGPDVIPPVITLNGNAIVNVVQGTAYNELGASALDNIDGDISGSVVISGDIVDPNELGNYQITYNVSDAAGNAANEVVRTVNVVVPNPVSVVIHEGYFETGWDGWIDGGSDAKRKEEKKAEACENEFAIELKDNSGEESSMTSEVFDLSSYSSVDIAFEFYPKSMESGEDFWLRYNDGSGWVTIATFVSGTDFDNNSCYSETVNIDASQYNLTSGAQFRFQCDAGSNSDKVYIDAVMITAHGGTNANNSRPGTQQISNNLGIDVDHSERLANNNIDIDITVDSKEIVLYPNPTASLLHINSSGVSIENIRIYSFNGTLLKEVSGLLIADGIDVSDMVSGMYYVVIQSEDDTIVKRITKM